MQLCERTQIWHTAVDVGREATSVIIIDKQMQTHISLVMTTPCLLSKGVPLPAFVVWILRLFDDILNEMPCTLNSPCGLPCYGDLRRIYAGVHYDRCTAVLLHLLDGSAVTSNYPTDPLFVAL
eukprot:SAG31_NODE_691_length_12779_cov_19.035095_10_plen_123_part_00